MRFPPWIYRQSAVLPYRLRDGSVEILLITSRRGGRWVIPKGIVEPGMTAPESAAKEAKEEAGIEGDTMNTSIGVYELKKWGGTCRIEVFPMKVREELDDWAESKIRRREWVPIRRALVRIRNGGLRKLVQSLPKVIAENPEARRIQPSGGEAPPLIIHLFRHAKSSWADPSLNDFDRPLAARGKRAAVAMGRYMNHADFRPDLVLSSSSARTRQTLDIALPEIGGDVPVVFERSLYLAQVRDMMARVRLLSDDVRSVMVVGHNPEMQALALRLIDGGDAAAIDRLRAKFPTAALATLVVKRDRWADLGPGSCELHSFVVPRDLED